MNPPKVEFQRTISKFRKREEISSSLVYFLCTTWSWAFSRRSRAVTAEKCTKKCEARAKLFWLLNLSQSPSSDLKWAVSRQSSPFCLFLAITRPQSPWNLKQAKKLPVNDKIREIRDKQICLPSFIFEVASDRDQLWKTVRLNSFQNFNLFHFCRSVESVVSVVLL